MNIADVAQHVHALESKVKAQADEIERLREALQEIAAWKLSPDADTPIYMANIAEDALKEKP